MGPFTFSLTSFVVLALFHAITVESAAVPAIFVFGDSVADVGNNNYLNVPISLKSNFPHNGIDFPGQVPTGRFTNGFNTIDYIAMKLGFKESPPPYLSIKNVTETLRRGVNFASAGSGILQTTGKGTLDMATQVNYFAKTKHDLTNLLGAKVVDDCLAIALFYFVTANNDMFAYYYATGAANSTENAQFISNLVDEFLGHLKMIYNLGARKFAITGTGLLGCAPYLRSLNPTGGCIDELNQLSEQFNAVAEPRIKQLSCQLAGFKYSYYNSIIAANVILAVPHKYGFKELTSACCGAGKFNGEAQCTPNATYCSNRNEYLFWDRFHPTQSLYSLTAKFQLVGSIKLVTPINLKQLVVQS
ncbi:GDSL esterase/lipase [Carex littledalei]|uniref:GDSL esterase/lipase n=1 Tax=Carex littledalei TaxID=544730 RepID=A0A833QHX9_9POAL|nr:GDSL esterase/lipase [Carex littledalei]